MKRLNFVFLAVLILVGCSATLENYDSPEKVYSNTNIVTDKYDGSKIVTGPKQYFNRDRNSGTWFALRQMKKDEIVSWQVVVEVLEYEWSFFDRAYWEGGTEAEFVKIDSYAGTGASVYTVEQFALNITEEMLSRYSKQEPLKFKVYGKRNTQEVMVPSEYIKGFMMYVSDHAS